MNEYKLNEEDVNKVCEDLIEEGLISSNPDEKEMEMIIEAMSLSIDWYDIIRESVLQVMPKKGEIR